MMRVLNKVTVLLFTGAVLAGCSKSGGEGSSNPHADVKANAWILEKIAKEYLYNTYAKNLKNPDYNINSEVFFKSILSSDTKDNDGKHSNGDNYFYSYMERIPDGKGVGFGVASNTESTYGIEYIYFTASNAAKVLYVTKDSPAYIAGIQRGDMIKAVNGSTLNISNYKVLRSGSVVTLTVSRAGVDMTINVGSSVAVTPNPIFLDTIYVDKYSGRKIGYFVYNQFETGPKGPMGGDFAYDIQMKNVFHKFKTNGINDLILDLRYNGGGYLSSCNLLASMIVPASKLGANGKSGEIFCKSVYNDESSSLLKFLSASGNINEIQNVDDCNLNLTRLYLLTGMWTASASEQIINGLRPFMTVNVIGVETEGKNVGSYAIESKLHKMDLYPITFRIYNALDQSDYSDGFTPNTYKNELASSSVPFYELGDIREMLLNEAMAQIIGVRASSSAAFTKSVPSSETVRSSLESRRVKGAIGEPRQF